MIHPEHLKKYIIKPTLKDLGLYSEQAVNLLLGTAAQESQCGLYLKQLGEGPALGIYQMEPATYGDIIKNFLFYKPLLLEKIVKISLPGNECAASSHRTLANALLCAPSMLIGNLYYATCFTRLHYLRIPQKLPSADDVEGLGAYWKKHYNTAFGKGTVHEFIENYHNFIKEEI